MTTHPAVFVGPTMRKSLSSVRNQFQAAICWACVIADLMTAYTRDACDQPIPLSIAKLVDRIYEILPCKPLAEDSSGGFPFSICLGFALVHEIGGLCPEKNYQWQGRRRSPALQNELTEKDCVVPGEVVLLDMAEDRVVNSWLDSGRPIAGIIRIRDGDFVRYRGTNQNVFMRDDDLYEDGYRTGIFPVVEPQNVFFHALTIVAYGRYGKDNEKGFFWVKNSWGPQWGGLDGYGRVDRRMIFNKCGIRGVYHI